MSLKPAVRLSGLGPTLIRRVMQAAPPACLNLGLGQADAPVPAVLSARLEEAGALAGYVPNPGIVELREAIATEADVDAARVIVTCGAQEAIALTILGMINVGDEVLVPDPAFPVYSTLTTIAGGVPVSYTLSPRDSFRPTWEQIAAAITSKTRLVVLNSPANPTGACATPSEWRHIAEHLERRGLAVLSDEVYLDLPQGEEPHPSILAHNQTTAFVASSLSKRERIAGWRLGWLITPPELAVPLTALHQQLVTSAPSLVQRAALGAFTPEAARERSEFGATLRRQRATAMERLAAIGFEIVSGQGALYLWVRHPRFPDDMELVDKLLREAEVITMPGRAFGAAGHGYLRISYALSEPKLSLAFDRIERVLSGA